MHRHVDVAVSVRKVGRGAGEPGVAVARTGGVVADAVAAAVVAVVHAIALERHWGSSNGRWLSAVFC